MAPARRERPCCSIKPRIASTCSATRSSTSRTTHGCRRRRRKTSSPKSLSSVTSTRPSSHANASSASSEARASSPRADRTSCPSALKASRNVRDAAHASRRNFTKPLEPEAGHTHARPQPNDARIAGRPGYPRVPVPGTPAGSSLPCLPAASMPSTCSTAIRMSRRIGFPPKTSARTVMRSSSSDSLLMFSSP